MIKSRLRVVTAAVVASLSMTLAACAGGAGGAGDGSEETETVRIGTLRGQPHFYQPFLYEQFAPEGVEFEVTTIDSTPGLNDALVSGSIDFAITGVTPTISSIAQERDLAIIASAADGGAGLVGNGETSLEELRGGRIGFMQGTAPEVALRLLIQEAGMSVDDFDLVAIPAPEMASALATGDVDAFMGVEIGVSLAKAAGGSEVLDVYTTPIGRVNVGLVTTGERIETDPELVQQVVDTHVATTTYMRDNLDEWLPQMVVEFGGDEAVFRSAMENFWLRSDLDQQYLDQLEALATEMNDMGLISTVPPTDDLVNVDFTS